MSVDQGKKNIVITGDVFIDWNMAFIKKQGFHYPLTNTHGTEGGTLLLAKLVRTMLDDLERTTKKNDYALFHPGFPEHPIPGDPQYVHSFLTFESLKGEKDIIPHWRITRFLGYDEDPLSQKTTVHAIPDCPEHATIMVLNDFNLGFRRMSDAKIETNLPRCLKGNQTPDWIVYKMSYPIAQDNLWNSLKDKRNRMIVLVTANELRRMGIKISLRSSWEQVSMELTWQMHFRQELSELAECAYVMVLFPYSGVVVFDNRQADPREMKAQLVYDPLIVEGEWASYYTGRITGVASTFAAAVVRELLHDSSKPAITRAAHTGLHAMRLLHKIGYENKSIDNTDVKLEFPYLPVAQTLVEQSDLFSEIQIPVPMTVSPRDTWTILSDRYPSDITKIAADIARRGLESSLKDVPVATFGTLQTVERDEIESYYALHNIIEQYVHGNNHNPLCIAVFGPSGSGRLFAMEQLVRTIEQEQLKQISFNVAEFTNTQDLTTAFHVVRDSNLTGNLSLVFWNEFDTSFGDEFFWIKFFLSTMKDGTFKEGRTAYHIGKSIFVFVGSCNNSFEEFCSAYAMEPQRPHSAQVDFISCIKGHINLRGLNQFNSCDRNFPIRRAIMMHHLFKQHAPHLFINNELQINESVLHAFLLTSGYVHGVRSIEHIILMSDLKDRKKFELSCLPHAQQMWGHLIDPHDFLKITQRVVFPEAMIDQMAEEAHKIFLRTTYPSLPIDEGCYQKAAESTKQASREVVRGIPAKLERLGYVFLPLRGSKSVFRLHPASVELMAQEEHMLWMEEKLQQGWKLGYPPAEAPEKFSPYLVSWEKLPERVKWSYRSQFLGLPQLIEKSGYMLMKTDTSGGMKMLQELAPNEVITHQKVLRIGVIGHRRFDPTPQMREKVTLVLRELAMLADKFVIVSPLAQGADLFFTRIALEALKAELRSPLPFHKHEYLEEFTDSKSRVDFDELSKRAQQIITLPPLANPEKLEQGYKQAAEFVLDDCQVLIALWNGVPGEYIGSTADVVHLARMRKHPLIWINTTNFSISRDFMELIPIIWQ